MTRLYRPRLLRFNERGICAITGHAFDVLQGLPNDCVQCTVTSPPYWGLRHYDTPPQLWGGNSECKHNFVKELKGFCSKCFGWWGELGCEPTPQDYVRNLCMVMNEVYRVTKPDGVLFLNLGDTYANTGGRTKQGKNSKRLGRKNVVEQNRPKGIVPFGIPVKNLIGIPWMVAFELRERGWIVRSECVWHKRNAMPEATSDRPNRDHEHVFMLTKNPRYYFNMDAVRVPVAPATISRDQYTRITKGKDGPYAVAHDHETPSNPNGRNLRTVWDIPTQVLKESHFAVFPKKIPKMCISAGSRPGDIVLDPFGGAGTTAIVASLLGRRCISIELNPDYMGIQNRRHAGIQRGLFHNYEME